MKHKKKKLSKIQLNRTFEKVIKAGELDHIIFDYANSIDISEEFARAIRENKTKSLEKLIKDTRKDIFNEFKEHRPDLYGHTPEIEEGYVHRLRK